MTPSIIDEEIRNRLKEALLEDLGECDLTTLATVPAGIRASGKAFAKAEGVFCGYEIFREVYALLDETLECQAHVEEGQKVSPGTLVAEVRGEGRQILHGERLALNLRGRMSGVATLTRNYLDKMNNPSVALLDTRKTLPLWRALDKYAVRAGGAQNHRLGLHDMILIKENHIALAGGVRQAVQSAITNRPDGVRIEVEVRSLEELKEALQAGPDLILLDNFSLEQLRKAVNICGGRVPLEASGGITVDNIAEVASTGVNRISVGALTHSAKAFDLSMIVELL